MQKFYLHAATTPLTGTLPGATTQSATSPSVTATGASTNRTMDGTIGTSQTSAALTTLANTTAQPSWFRRFLSPALAAQTITAAANTWQLHIAGSVSSTNSNFDAANGVCYVWRPSTGSLVGKLWDTMNLTFTMNSATEFASSGNVPTSVGTSVTCSNGDVLVYELWRGSGGQAMATAYTNTFFYDGTTEDSATSNAAFLLAPADLPLAAAAAALRPKQTIVSQAVQRSLTRCQKLTQRKSGLFVPAEWEKKILVPA